MATRKSNGKTPTTQRKDFWELLGEHLSSGLRLELARRSFMLASEARWNAEEETFESGEPNCWFVRLAASAGHTNAVSGSFCAWRRSRTNMSAGAGGNQFEPRIYRWDKLIKKTGGQ
jgi:hypothetical protein